MKWLGRLFFFGALVSAISFPWPYTALLALGAAVTQPVAPLAVGLFVDFLYYAPSAGRWPLASMAGLIVGGLAWFVRGRLRADIIE